MEKIIINGGRELHGTINISGAKNAAVGILPAAILCNDVCIIENVPSSISDVTMMLRMLSSIGAEVTPLDKHTVKIDSTKISSYSVGYEMTKHLRASYYLLGALLGRFGKAEVAMPGGCDLGVRPIDQHVKGFEALGAVVNIEENSLVKAHAENGRLQGNTVYLDLVSVGATMNVMMAAVRAKGLTVIENAAKEPHIVDLANFLNSMGADVRGAGTDTIKIRGVEELHGCTYSIIPDQIEAGTYMLAAAATNGDVIINNVIPKHLESITSKLVECGVTVEDYDECIRVCGNGRPKRCNIKTMPHPGFPTDMQPQMAVFLSVAEGTSVINESIWENRFRYVEQLIRMGASIKVDGKVAVVEGVEGLTGCAVKADDLRAGAAMLIAGLIASGTTEIGDITHIDRGYEDVVKKLQAVGADIRRVNYPDEEGNSSAD